MEERTRRRQHWIVAGCGFWRCFKRPIVVCRSPIWPSSLVFSRLPLILFVDHLASFLWPPLDYQLTCCIHKMFSHFFPGNTSDQEKRERGFYLPRICYGQELLRSWISSYHNLILNFPPCNQDYACVVYLFISFFGKLFFYSVQIDFVCSHLFFCNWWSLPGFPYPES